MPNLRGTKKRRTTKHSPAPKPLSTKQERQWAGMFSRLVDYKQQHGHCKVPYKFAQDKKLGQWVVNQRYRMRQLPANDPRRQMLDSIGFHWGADVEPQNMEETIVEDASTTVARLVESRSEPVKESSVTLAVNTPPPPSSDNSGGTKSLIIWEGIYSDRSYIDGGEVARRSWLQE